MWPNGEVINIGVYGGTPQAGMSPSDAGNIGDVNCDSAVDGKDLSRLAEFWLTEGVLLAEDINRNGRVNFGDFAWLASNWLWQR